MRMRIPTSSIALFFIITHWCFFGLAFGEPTQPTVNDSTRLLPTPPIREFLESKCIDCHTGSDAEGGLDLSKFTNLPLNHGVDPETTRDTLTTWVRIYDRVNQGEMPPRDSLEDQKPKRGDPRGRQRERQNPPPRKLAHSRETARFLTSTESWVKDYQADQFKTSGRVQGRRLTNLQLERTLHSLLGTDIPLAKGFADEAKVDGFHSIAEGQAMSHFQLEQHLRAVDLALDDIFQRMTSANEKPFVKKFTPNQIAMRKPGQRNREPELFDSKAVVWNARTIFYGRMAITTSPEDGWYRFKIRATSLNTPEGHGVWCSVRSGRCVSNAPLLETLGGFEATDTPREWTFEGWLPKGEMLEVRPADATLKVARFDGGQVGAGEGTSQKVPGVAIHEVHMERIHRGPDIESTRKILLGDFASEIVPQATDKNESKKQSDAPKRGNLAIRLEVQRLMQHFANKAFRRPVPLQELAPYVDVTTKRLIDGDPADVALRSGYRAILCSPRFLYFTETPGELDDYAIAARLSYFLWNDLPDEKLTTLAAQSQLRQTEVLGQEIQRMLNDPKGANFVRDFADQWLDLSEIDFTEPDPKLYRDFDLMVQHAMLEETRTYLQKLLDENLNITHLVDSSFTMLNSRLARFYDIPEVQGDHVRVVNLRPEDQRGGLLTQGSILKVTANGTTTSPVLRGVWVSERILGEHIPPPPTNVAAIEPDIRGATTLREQLELHKSNTSCASCHVKIDPPGFALENFDPSGKWRTQYPAARGVKRPKVDPSYEGPDGQKFRDLTEYKQILVKNPERLAKNFAEQIIACGTGTPVQFADRAELDAILRQASKAKYGIRSVLEATLMSPLFLSK